MRTKEQALIKDVLRALYRSSPLLLDNLDIPIKTDVAYRLYCLNYNRALLVDLDNSPTFLSVRPEDQHITVKTMSSEQEKVAVLQYAHDYVMTHWRGPVE